MNKNPHTNGKLAAMLDDVLACLKDLARRGCIVREIRVNERDYSPRIEIAPPPRRARLKGGLRMMDRTGRRGVDIWATRHRNCQVEWRVVR